MSSKFVKKLKKELKKSPGKAVVLAALLGVALWFWAPLVKNLLGGSSPSTPPTAGAANNSASPVVTAPGTPAPTQPRHTWKQIADAIENDPRMVPAEQFAPSRNPFRVIVPEKPKEEVKPVELPPVVLDVLPADAGLVLTSTIVSPTRRVARLNGKTYREGDVIAASLAGKSLDYILVSIGPRSVVLVLGEKEYELKMARSQTGGATTATVGVSSDSPDFDPSILGP